jgi:alginate O-acetyltransferase complex protein AlgI
VLFNSYVFVLAFLPLALVGFFVAARFGQRAAGIWLIATSLTFYGWWNPAFVPLLLASVVANWLAGELIHRLANRPQWQTASLVAAIAANIAALIYYKYLASMLGFLHIAFADPVLPLGISFFTFTQIGYLLDRRSGLVRDASPLNYALFVTFFPHLIAGPIVHNREIMPQFADHATYRFDPHNLAVGLSIFIIGLLKKCLLADPVSAAVAPSFAHPEALTLFAAWHVALAYSLQLYFDFSGYSDMAIGLARMFNVRFPLNFNSPYKAHSVVEYWQRWHMTLTRYLNLYLYDPIALAIARRRQARGLPTRQATLRCFSHTVLLPTFVTLTLAGVWHGSGLTFLVFGLLHASYIAINQAWRIMHPRKTPAAGAVLLTYLAVLVGAVVFRAPTLGVAWQLLSAMLGSHGVAFAMDAHATRELVFLITLYLIVWGAPNTQQIMRAWEPALARVQPGPLPALLWQPTPRWAMAMGGAATLGLLAIGGTGEFLYFQF